MATGKRQRDNAIMIRVNDAELRRFQRQAGREAMATWCRRILLEHIERAERRASQ